MLIESMWIDIDARVADMVLLTTAEAAGRLGVKNETLYAYVSRGLIGRVRSEDGRSSRFEADEVDALARSRRGGPPGPDSATSPIAGMAIGTDVTTLAPDGVRYRGRDAAVCARTMTFESVAEWLWSGVEPGPSVTWASDPALVAAAVRASRLLPSGALLPDHLRVMTAVIAAHDPMRFDPRPEAFMAATRSLLAALVDALPLRRPGAPPKLRIGGSAVSGSLAARLWIRLSPLRPDPSALAAFNAAMVLLADHELATSTLGVRIAASTRADPYACIAAGLGVLAGPLHGSASAAVHHLLVAASQPEGPTAAVAALLRRGDRVPGFGHPLYPDGDPRAVALLDLLRSSASNRRRMAIVDGVEAAVGRRKPAAPNVDFALAALGFVAMMPPDAGETAFAIARSAGWIAHALEEMTENPLRYRIRAHPRS